MANALSQRYSAWQALEQDCRNLQQHTLADLFSADPKRAGAFSRRAAGLFADFSKNHITGETLNRLLALAREAKLEQAIADMFAGEKINTTEGRKVLHVALRSGGNKTDEEQAVQQTLARIAAFVDRVHSGEWRGFSGKAISDVVNIGIGGSDLGPRMVTAALLPYHVDQLNVHFVSNVDGADLAARLDTLDPATTLFVVASKSFTTLETLENANTARQWMEAGGCGSDDIARHFVAVSSNIEKAVAFGIAENNIFPMWGWVGGRYSLWSAIGLPIALAVGMEGFNALRAGARAMDEHFTTADFNDNLPVLMALITFWYSQFWGATSQVILPYNHLLHHLPAFLQQLDMESLGKSVDRDGNAVNYLTGLVIWGSEGTNGQHSFHQLLHQGRQLIPADFIVNRRARHPYQQHQAHLFACCLSQSQALMQGKSLAQARQEILDGGASEADADRLAPHKLIPGNRPSTTIMMEELTPATLGALIAAYEHKVFTLSVLLNINAFDQWGVELGKQLGGPIYQALAGESEKDFDASTQQLVNLFQKGL